MFYKTKKEIRDEFKYQIDNAIQTIEWCGKLIPANKWYMEGVKKCFQETLLYLDCNIDTENVYECGYKICSMLSYKKSSLDNLIKKYDSEGNEKRECFYRGYLDSVNNIENALWF